MEFCDAPEYSNTYIGCLSSVTLMCNNEFVVEIISTLLKAKWPKSSLYSYYPYLTLNVSICFKL